MGSTELCKCAYHLHQIKRQALENRTRGKHRETHKRAAPGCATARHGGRDGHRDGRGRGHCAAPRSAALVSVSVTREHWTVQRRGETGKHTCNKPLATRQEASTGRNSTVQQQAQLVVLREHCGGHQQGRQHRSAQHRVARHHSSRQQRCRQQRCGGGLGAEDSRAGDHVKASFLLIPLRRPHASELYQP